MNEPILKSIALSTGVTLEYAVQGAASGTPIIFLHGVSDSWRSFEGVLANLPDTLPAFALSLRGHGNSSRPATGYLYENMANDVQAFLDALEIPNALVVGHSMGAMVALDFAARYAPLTAGLVVIAGWPTIKGNADMQEFVHASILGLSDPVDALFIREFQLSTLSREIGPNFIETAVEESRKLPAHVWKEAFQGFLTTDPCDISRIAAPTLIVWGDRDSYATHADQEALLRAIPAAELIVYKDTGHAVHWEHPGKFTADLLSFRSRQAIGERSLEHAQT